MADPNLDDITDEAAVEAELKRLKQEQPPTPPEGTDTGIPPDEPAPEKAAIEVQPGTEEPKPEPPAEAKAPVQKTKEEEMREGTLRRLLREAQREIAELRKQAPAAAGLPAAGPKVLSKDDDPVAYFDKELTDTKAEIARLRQERAQGEQLNAIQRAEMDFERTHPDYRDALKHAEERHVARWEKSGYGASQVKELKDAVRQGRAGNENFRGYVQHIENIAQRDDVQQLAEKDGRDPEDIAAWLTARDNYMVGERQKVWKGAMELGRNPAEIAYELAIEDGYRPQAAAPPPTTNNGESARERVLRAKDVSEATRSLSESSTGESVSPGPKVIRNRNDVLNLNDDELDALISSNRFKEL